MGVGLNFSAFFFLLRILEKPAFGKFAVLWSLSQLAGALSRGGLERQYIRETGKSVKGPPAPKEIGLLGEINTLQLTFWAIVSFGIGAIGLFVYEFAIWEVAGIALIGLVMGQVPILSSQMRVRDHVFAAQVVDGLLLQASMFLVLLVYFFLERGTLVSERAETLFLVQVLIVLTYAAIGWCYAHRVAKLRFALAYGLRSRFFSLRLPVVLSFAVVSMINVALNQTAFLVGGKILSLSELADYRVAIQFSSFVLLPLPIINLVAAPHLASLRLEGGTPAQKRHAFISVLQMSLVISIPIFAIVTIFAPTLVEFYGGKDYENAVTLVRILSVGALINALTGPVGLMLLTFDDELLYARVGIFWLVVNVALIFLLTSTYGVLGAVTSVATTVALMNLTLLYFVMTRHVQLQPSPPRDEA